MNIYTKAGDKGKSYIAKNKTALSKSSAVFSVLGTLDELSSTLGFLHTSKIPEIKKITISVQGDLLAIGSIVAGKTLTQDFSKYFYSKITEFENTINIYTQKLPLLKSFIIPGGCVESSYLHLARVVCRRLERIFVKYIHESRRKDLDILERYLNRLSDLLFVMARYTNKKRKYKDIVWKALK